jgi:hypothetical protein
MFRGLLRVFGKSHVVVVQTIVRGDKFLMALAGYKWGAENAERGANMITRSSAKVDSDAITPEVALSDIDTPRGRLTCV